MSHSGASLPDTFAREVNVRLPPIMARRGGAMRERVKRRKSGRNPVYIEEKNASAHRKKSIRMSQNFYTYDQKFL